MTITNKQTAQEKKFLAQHGLKEVLLNKLEDWQINDLAALALDYVNSPNCSKILSRVASMEMQNKKGSALLIGNKIATIEQVRCLTQEQIYEVIEIFKQEHDLHSAAYAVRDIIINMQQTQLSFHYGTEEVVHEIKYKQ